jgi:hypothetical protein
MKTKGHLWTCPRCRHKFTTRNLWHSCANYRISDHFLDRKSNIYKTYRKIVKYIRALGPITVYAQKTRIVIMKRVRFAGFMARKDHLDFSLWMTKKINHPLLKKTETFGDNSFGIHFRLTDPDQIDDKIEGWIKETYYSRL